MVPNSLLDFCVEDALESNPYTLAVRMPDCLWLGKRLWEVFEVKYHDILFDKYALQAERKLDV